MGSHSSGVDMTFVMFIILFGMSSHGIADRFGPLAVDDFTKLDDNYYRGGQPTREDYARLATLGIKTVVDLRQRGPDDEQALLENAGMKFYSIPMTTSFPPSDSTIHQFLQIVNDPVNQPVFVHCEDGHIRTGVMTALYRINHDGWTADQAYAEMKKHHFHCFWHHALKRHHALKHFVYRYYDSIHSRQPAKAGN
jgi:protein tyrosine/serine phosphatase